MTYLEAKEILFNKTPTDKILDVNKTKEFFDFLVSCGGDNCTYRIYNNGKVYER